MPNESVKPKILITGASGLLGAAALLGFSSDSYEISGTYLRHPIHVPNQDIQELDLTDWSLTQSFLVNLNPDIIFHTAAAVNVDECESNREMAYKTNVLATKHLAEHCGANGKLFVYISSDAFFEGPTNKTFSETDIPTPLNYYGETKYLAEKEVAKAASRHLILRTNLYGWNYQAKDSLAEWMLKNFQAGIAIPLIRDVFYTPILTNTLVDIVSRLIEAEKTGTYHVASDRPISKLEFGQILCKTFDIPDKYIQESSVKDINFKARRSNNMALNVEKLKKEFPELDLGVVSHLKTFRDLYLSKYPEKLKSLI